MLPIRPVLALAGSLAAATQCLVSNLAWAGSFEQDAAQGAQVLGLAAKELGQGLESPPAPAPCPKDLSNAAVVMLSGGAFDAMNPPEVRARMDAYVQALNATEHVRRCSGGRGLAVRLLEDQTTDHLHQSRWRDACDALIARDAGPIVVVGHSNGGASAVSLARCLEGAGREVELLITADSVPTGVDLGDVFTVPATVKVNVNTFVVPNVVTWTLPFPFGKANRADPSGATEVINIGLDYLLPAAVSHRNAFYDFAGGDATPEGYSRPFVLFDLTLAALGGASPAELRRLAHGRSEELSRAAKIPMTLEAGGTTHRLGKPWFPSPRD